MAWLTSEVIKEPLTVCFSWSGLVVEIGLLELGVYTGVFGSGVLVSSLVVGGFGLVVHELVADGTHFGGCGGLGGGGVQGLLTVGTHGCGGCGGSGVVGSARVDPDMGLV